MGGVNTRWARDQTNGKYIFWTEEWKRWYDVQHKYLEKTKIAVNDYYGDLIWNVYLKKMQQLLLQTIDQRNTIKSTLWETKEYTQKSRSFYGMHEEVTKLNWMMWDSLKKILLDEYCFL
jgi:hypothetical protein